MYNLLILSHEFQMKFPEGPQNLSQFINWWQNGDSEVVCSRLFTEAAARDGTNACFLQHSEAIEAVRRLARLLGDFYSLWGYVDSRKGIHGSLYLVAVYSFNRVERPGYQLGLVNNTTTKLPLTYNTAILLIFHRNRNIFILKPTLST